MEKELIGKRRADLISFMICNNSPNYCRGSYVQRTVYNFEDAHTNRDSIWVVIFLQNTI